MNTPNLPLFYRRSKGHPYIKHIHVHINLVWVFGVLGSFTGPPLDGGETIN